jgi:hypothetical protein
LDITFPRCESSPAAGHRYSAEILKGVSQTHQDPEVKKCGLGGERFTALGKWRVGDVVHAFIVASVLREVDVV